MMEEGLAEEIWSDEHVFERYIVYGDSDELKKSNINLRNGKIEKIEFVEDDELPEEFNWCYITFIDKKTLENLTILDFCYIPENEEYKEELDKHKENIGIVTEIIDNAIRVRCFIKCDN